MPGPLAAAGAPPAGGRNERAWFAGFALGALALYALSPRTEWGDSLHYALAIESGGVARLFEPGHLLWRPLGWLAWQVARLFQPAARAFEPLSLITLVVSAVGAGLAAVFFRRRLPRLPAAFAAVAYATGYAYWSYATTACGYNACATLGLAGLLLAWPEEDRRPGAGRLAGAAAALALGTLLWLPTLLLVPAVALAAGFERRAERTHFGWARAAGTLAGMLLPPVLVYAVCWHGRGAPGGGGFLPWVQAARHDQPLGLGIVGAARAAYGWTRLVWQPWRVALDPTQRGWARLMCARVWWDWGLWKPAAAWLLLAAAVVAGSLRRPRGGWATWALLAVAALPHGLLALTFKGSDPERWLLPAAPLLVLVLRWALGPAPGRGRTAAVCAALALVPLVGAVDRFGPRGNVENRPQMKLMRAAAGQVRRGDVLYFAGELDEVQLNRTIQTRWNAEWRYFTGAVVVDVSTSPTLALEPAVGIAPPPGVERREFISEQVLAGFPEGATLAEGAQDQRDELVRRLPEIPPPVAFEAAGVRFFQLRARPAGGPAARR